MAKNLRKFVNPKFIKSVDLELLKRLFERHGASGEQVKGLFDGEAHPSREDLLALFAGPEDVLAQWLVADLHRISELGTEHGVALLQSRAERQQIVLGESAAGDAPPPPLDPKHFALLAFLDHPAVFDAAADLMALEARSSLGEYVGPDEDVEAQMNADTQAAFEAAARELFRQDHRSPYCRIGWYDDDGELTVVVTHGAAITLRPVIEGENENVLSYRAAEHAVLCYHAPTGRLKVGGVLQARRAELADIFANTMLCRPGFFEGSDSQNLYTLAPVEERGLPFRIDHAYDPEITRVQITEIQIDRIVTNTRNGSPMIAHSLLVKDNRMDAGAALSNLVPHGLTFGPNHYRIGHLVMRVHFGRDHGRPVKVTIKVKPPSQAVFKRHRFEERIMELLRRNRFCHERDSAQAPAAAE